MSDELELESFPTGQRVLPIAALRFILGKNIDTKLEASWKNLEVATRDSCPSYVYDAGRMWIMYTKLELEMLIIRWLGISIAGMALFFILLDAFSTSIILPP